MRLYKVNLTVGNPENIEDDFSTIGYYEDLTEARKAIKKYTCNSIIEKERLFFDTVLVSFNKREIAAKLNELMNHETI